VTAVYVIGGVPITFARPLLDGADDTINIYVGSGLPAAGYASHARIRAADIETLYAYAASHEPLPWGQPSGLPELIEAASSEGDRGIFRRPVIWPDTQRRIVWGFIRIGWWPTFVESPFQADAFQAGAFQEPGPGEAHVFRMTVIDAGPAGVQRWVGTDGSWRVLILQLDGGSMSAEPAGWNDTGFDDSAWDPALDFFTDDPLRPDWAAFGTGYDDPKPVATPNAHPITVEEIIPVAGQSTWLGRTTFELDADLESDATLWLNSDNELDGAWVNGHEIASIADGNWGSLHSFAVPAGYLTAGENVLGLRVQNRAAGGGYGALAIAMVLEPE